MAATPQGVKVEIAFTTTPDDPSPSYTDITAYVLDRGSITITRGRQDEYGQVQPATCTLTLDNRDGRFTPGYASGAYYPNVKLYKKLRVSTVAPAAVSTRFVGYVTEWPTEWPTGVDTYAEAQIVAVDRFARLGDLAKMRSVIEEEYLLDDPALYYTLGEPSGAVTAGDTSLVGTAVAAVVQQGSGGTIEFAASTGPGTDGLSSPLFTRVDATNGKYLQAMFVAPMVDGACTLECFFNTTQTGVTLVDVQSGASTSSSAHTQLLVVGGKLRGFHPNASVTSAASVDDGETHHAAVVYDGSTGITLYLDGVSAGTSASGAVSPMARDRLNVGGQSGGTDDVMDGTIAHVAYYTTALSSTRVLAHANAGLTGFEGERSDQRIARYASYAGIPTAEQDLETGLSTSISTYDTTGKTPLQAMQDIAATESGLLFMAGDGKLTFHARSHRYNAASVLTCSAVNLDVRFALNRQLTYNDVTASRPNGITYRSVDAASITDIGTLTQTLTLYVTTDNEVINAADWAAHRTSTPASRIGNLSVDLFGTPSLATAILGLEIGDLVTVSSLPTQAPASSLTLFVEGWTEVITTHTWRFTFNTSPASTSNVWQLDSSTYSVLDSTTVLAY